jgi:hypothetical protein
MRRLHEATLLLAVSIVSDGSGCGAPCSSSSLCAVDGTADELSVCDGVQYRECGASDRGLTIACRTRPQAAVCTPSGWTFQPTGPQ